MIMNNIAHIQNLILAKQQLEEAIQMSTDFKTDNEMISNFMRGQAEIFQQISDLIEPEKVIAQIEEIALNRVLDEMESKKKSTQN